jgi:hypothetical protein
LATTDATIGASEFSPTIRAARRCGYNRCTGFRWFPSVSHPARNDIVSDDKVWSELNGQCLVLDLSSPYVVLGTLAQTESLYVTLIDADVHDLRDSKTTRELYVLESRRHGVRCNRQRVSVSRAEIVSVSRLEDVVE